MYKYSRIYIYSCLVVTVPSRSLWSHAPVDKAPGVGAPITLEYESHEGSLTAWFSLVQPGTAC